MFNSRTNAKLIYGLIFIISALFLWGVAYASVIPYNMPSLFSPGSMTVVLPLLILDDSPHFHSYAMLLATLAIPIAFALWSFPLLWGQIRIPKRSKVLTVILILLSIVHLAGSWSYGVEYQGAIHTLSMYLYNIALWAILFMLARRNSRNSIYTTNFLFHWFLFAWLGWVSFPWLGELI
jgi:hypothetical protein